MKKLFTTLFAMLSLLWCLCASAQTLVFHLADGTNADVELSSDFRMYTVGGKTIVCLADGSTKEFSQSDILTITYREIRGDVNRDNVVDVADIASIISIMAGEGTGTDTPTPSNSTLSSRLKDNYGNPINLMYVGLQDEYGNNNGGIYYEYDANGVLTSFGIPNKDRISRDYYYVNGFTYQNGKAEYDINLTLNDNGLVSEVSLTTGDYLFSNYVVTYNNKQQVIKIEGEIYIDDRFRNSKGTEVILLTWENDNLAKVERSYTETVKREKENSSYPFSTTINYGNEPNACRQYTKEMSEIRFFWGEFGIEQLFMIGLFGVGPVNLPTEILGQKYTYTLNPNGTIATENNDIYIYK